MGRPPDTAEDGEVACRSERLAEGRERTDVPAGSTSSTGAAVTRGSCCAHAAFHPGPEVLRGYLVLLPVCRPLSRQIRAGGPDRGPGWGRRPPAASGRWGPGSALPGW